MNKCSNQKWESGLCHQVNSLHQLLRVKASRLASGGERQWVAFGILRPTAMLGIVIFSPKLSLLRFPWKGGPPGSWRSGSPNIYEVDPLAQGMMCDEHGNVPYSSPFKTGLVARLLSTKCAVRRQPSAVSPLGTDSLLGHATLKFFGFASSHLPPPTP